MNFSHEYVGALAIVIAGIFQAFKVDTTVEQITSVLTALFGLYVAYRRFSKGDITALGRKF